MRDNFEKLNQLLEQEQCEFTGIPDGFAGQTPDRKLLKALHEYRKTGNALMARKIAAIFRRSSHVETVHLLAEKIRQAAEEYTVRDFGSEQNTYLQDLMQKARDIPREFMRLA